MATLTAYAAKCIMRVENSNSPKTYSSFTSLALVGASLAKERGPDSVLERLSWVQHLQLGIPESRDVSSPPTNTMGLKHRLRQGRFQNLL